MHLASKCSVVALTAQIVRIGWDVGGQIGGVVVGTNLGGQLAGDHDEPGRGT